MNKQFITDLKNSKYYSNLILNEDIICIYLGGSRGNNLATENSDFDLVAITRSGSCIDESKYQYLTYKGRKVH